MLADRGGVSIKGDVPTFKIVVAGSSSVGKTTFVKTFSNLMAYNHHIKPKADIMDSTGRQEKCSPTIGGDLEVVTMHIKASSFAQQTQKAIGVAASDALSTDKQITLQIFDTAGAERFHSVTLNYFRGAHCIMFFFDLTDLRTLKDVLTWRSSIIRDSEQPCVFALIGTKFDKCFLQGDAQFSSFTKSFNSWRSNIGPPHTPQTRSPSTKFRETEECLYICVGKTPEDGAQREINTTLPKQWAKVTSMSLYLPPLALLPTLHQPQTPEESTLLKTLSDMKLFTSSRGRDVPHSNLASGEIAEAFRNIQITADIMLDTTGDFAFIPFTSSNAGYNVVESMEAITAHLCEFYEVFGSAHASQSAAESIILTQDNMPNSNNAKITCC